MPPKVLLRRMRNVGRLNINLSIVFSFVDSIDENFTQVTTYLHHMIIEYGYAHYSLNFEKLSE